MCKINAENNVAEAKQAVTLYIYGCVMFKPETHPLNYSTRSLQQPCEVHFFLAFHFLYMLLSETTISPGFIECQQVKLFFISASPCQEKSCIFHIQVATQLLKAQGLCWRIVSNLSLLAHHRLENMV